MVKGFAGFLSVSMLVACGGKSSAEVDDSGPGDSGGARGTAGGGGTSGSSGSSDTGGSSGTGPTGGSGGTGGAGATSGSGPGCTSPTVTCSDGVVHAVSDCWDVGFQCGAGCRPGITTAEGANDPGILCNEYQAALGGECLDDFDCMSANFAIARCSSEGKCVLTAPKPVHGGGCGNDRVFPEIDLNEARVVRGPLCESGACVLRHYTIDPANTRCTSRCYDNRDCELMYDDTTSCVSAPLLDRPDIFVSVCMPPMPW